MPLHQPMSPMALTAITEDQRDKALQRTTEILRQLDKVRRTLELPPEHLPIVIETYGQVVHALLAEADREALAKRTTRQPLTLRSETRDYEPMKIRPGKSFSIIVRPQSPSFRPEDLAILGDRSHWLVHDIKVGNRSQFAANRGPVPGTEFGSGGILEHMRLETLQNSMDLVLCVEYVGPDPEGAVFEATMVGTCLAF